MILFKTKSVLFKFDYFIVASCRHCIHQRIHQREYNVGDNGASDKKPNIGQADH